MRAGAFMMLMLAGCAAAEAPQGPLVGDTLERTGPTAARTALLRDAAPVCEARGAEPVMLSEECLGPYCAQRAYRIGCAAR